MEIFNMWLLYVWWALVKIFFYYLALLTWILEIIMFASIVLIPIVLILREESDWWQKPFEEASYH